MSTDIRIKKGLDIKLKGKAQLKLSSAPRSKTFAIVPSNFHGITPKLVVKVGDKVNVGDTLFYSKQKEEVKFSSPVSGEVKEIVRGAKRVILSIIISADAQDHFKEFKVKKVDGLSSDEVKQLMLESGCWPFINQRPYDVIANPDDQPKSIFVSGLSTAPLSADVDFVLKNKESEFQEGIKALAKLTEGKVHLTVSSSGNSFLTQIKGAEIHRINPIHPAGNVGTQISRIDPINAGERVWTVKPQDVAAIGSLFLHGKYDPSIVVALAGSQVLEPQYYTTIRSAQLESITKGNLSDQKNRIINGNPLTGEAVSKAGFLGFYNDTISVIPEGDHYSFFGWVPFTGGNKFSMSRTFLSWLNGKKEYDLDTNMNGEERAFVLTGEMEKVFPLDIYPMQLLKAVMSGDIERMENLGIYEVAPEDFALVDFVSSSKIEAQDLIRKGLDIMIKEVG
ncbi:Na(+)-translocating NADH-quinone reductase subunit A [Namhaeicola litoreus]|uniref:Na(+)-translocating NADH-quinone reductase subunit A n=1 Tax=Namhaeicola litoreus TaxID=1052145 RepID=A0ABW3XZJ2_9FLAO